MKFSKLNIKMKKLLPLCMGIFFWGSAVAQEGNEAVPDTIPENPDTIKLKKSDETVYLGYSTQRRKDISGAIYTVTGEELRKSPVSNLPMTFAGRLAGLYTTETYSEPSRTTTNLYVRGISTMRANQPLVIIDGLVCSYNMIETLDYISASEVESITLLKDAASQALFGIQGANGVLVVTTKKGRPGKLKADIRVDQTFEQMSSQPTYINSAEYATLRNQAAYNDGKPLPFTTGQIAQYQSGENRNLYPDNNWRDMFLKDITGMQRVGIDLTGGNDRIVFYSNINFMHQGGLYNIDQTEYNPNNNFIWANFRSNVAVKLNKYLSSTLNLAGNVKREKIPNAFMSGVYYTMFALPPTTYGPTTPRVVDPVTGEVTSEGGGVVVTKNLQATPYALINRLGYTQHTVTNIYAQFALNLDMSFLTKGLNLNGSIAYQTNSVNSFNNTQSYSQWIRTDDPDKLEFERYGTDKDTPLAQGKGSSFYYNLVYKGMLDYSRIFGRHRVSSVAYTFYQYLSRADTGSPESLPYKRVSTGLEASYGYDDRYLVKFDLGYSGSEQYAREHRFVATPAVSAAWVISNESFMHGTDWLSNLKLRAAYGKTANDQSGLGRYAYLDNITLAGGGPVPYLGYLVTEKQYANPDIEPEISKKIDLGIDIGLFDNLSVSFDVFKERMENMAIPATASVPSYQGIPLNAFPTTNAGVFENKGYEIVADYTRSLNKNLTISIGGNLTYAKNTMIDGGESEKAGDYAYRKWSDGYSYGQQFGYLVDMRNGNGYFNTQAELDNGETTYDIGTPRLGDLKYYDLNADGHINEKDKAPLGYGAIPRFFYGFYGKVTYKGFDFSILFQGTGQYFSVYGPGSGESDSMWGGIYEYQYDGIFSSLHEHAWTQERYNNGEKIQYPALSTIKTLNHEQNSFFLYNRSYLRLKNAEIGYTLPKKAARAISADQIRIIVSGQNLLTWDKMKSDDFGPDAQYYMAIPIYRYYNIGVSVKF